MSEINYKEKIKQLYKQLSDFYQQTGNPDFEGVVKKYKYIFNDLKNYVDQLKDLTEGKTEENYNPEKVYKKTVHKYNENIKSKLEEIANKEPEGAGKIILNEIKRLLPPIGNKKSEEEEEEKQQEQPDQPEQSDPEQTEPVPVPTNPALNKLGGALNVRVSGENPTTPTIDDFINKKPEEEEEEEKQPENQPVPEEEQQPENQPVPEGSEEENQIVPSSNENNKLVEQKLKTLEDNPELDIIKGVGDVIEFMATQNLDDEMTDELIDKLLGLKDSHGNLLFNNRFQIEDLIRIRKKRRRIKYLLPKRSIMAEKPDEQKLILNPMLRRGRIAAMTSAKTKYFNYL